jgi:hypothetical protein
MSKVWNFAKLRLAIWGKWKPYWYRKLIQDLIHISSNSFVSRIALIIKQHIANTNVKPNVSKSLSLVLISDFS